MSTRIADRVKVLYIAGSWRSGSTLIGRVIGQAQDMVSVCEIASVWKLGVRQNEPCGCGAGTRDCSFWQAVFERGFGGLDADAVRTAMSHGLPMFHTSDALRMTLTPERLGGARFRRRLADQRAALGRLYPAVAAVSGKRCVVDGSKIPNYAIGLSTVPEIDLYVLHLVRDSRAVANSWLRRRQRDAGEAQEVSASWQDGLRQGIAWSRWNVIAETLLRRRAPYLRLRYEDFATDPRAALAAVARFVGEDMSSVPLKEGNVVHLADEHAADGNRMRFEKGDVPIRLDDRWQQELPAHLRRAVTAASWPLLLRYGYLSSSEDPMRAPARPDPAPTPSS